MGKVKYCFFPKNGIQRTNILHLSNPKAPSKVKRHILTSNKVNNVTKCAQCDDNGNVTLMAQGACCILQLMLQLCFPVKSKVQTVLTPIVIPDKNTHELENNVNPTSKKLKFPHFFKTFYVLTKHIGKV